MATKSKPNKPKAVKRPKDERPAEDIGPILELINKVVPNPTFWLDSPNSLFGLKSAREMINSGHEDFVRDTVLRYKYGIFS